MVEDTERRRRRTCPRRWRSPAASPCAAPATTCSVGDLLFRAGTVVRPAVAGVLASVNARTVVGVSARTCGGAVDRRRTGRRRRAAAAGPDPREQPDMLAAAARRGRLRGGRLRHRPRRRGGARGGAARGRRECDAIVTSGGCRWATTTSSRRCSADRRDDVDADRDQAGQAVRVRHARRHADLRAARQPGQLDGQLRDARPPGAAPDDGPPAPRSAAAVVGGQPTRASAAVRDGKMHSCGSRRRSRTTAATTSARSGPRAATSWRPRRWPTRSPSCPTATASRRAATSPRAARSVIARP